MLLSPRVAVPRNDGSDTAAVLALVKPVRARGSFAASLFGGRTEVVPIEGGLLSRPRFVPARADHPNLFRAEELLRRCWPAMYEQCGELLSAIHPYNDLSRTPEQWRSVHGSASHGFDLAFGAIRLTVDNAYGTAQAFVHETAHHKLRAFGVGQFTATRLITNDPSEVYESPVVADSRRPMTALVHAQYSFMHVTALDVAMYEHAENDEMRSAALCLVEKNVARMEAGRAEMSRYLRTDEEGKAFFAAFGEWSEEVLGRGHAILGF
jgi:HEXXH motif-containing protein